MVKKCVVCGKEFEGHGLRKYCSDKCHKRKQIEINQKYRLSHKEEIKERNRLYYLSHKKDKFRKCGVCGKAFNPGKGTGYKYCSDECRNVMKKVYWCRQGEKKKSICIMSNGNIRFTKNMVKAPPECVGKTTCLECTRERCMYG